MLFDVCTYEMSRALDIHTSSGGSKVLFKRRTFHVPNAIQTIDNEIYQLINYCLNCIRHMKSSTFEPGLSQSTLIQNNTIC